jgi:hypothetical protein
VLVAQGVSDHHLGARTSTAAGENVMLMNSHLHRTILSAAATAALAAVAAAPAAGAATAAHTVTVTAKRAYVDNKGPGRYFIGTIFKGNRFRIDRAARVTHGSAKGLWYHGTATVTGDHAKDVHGRSEPFKITGWVKATAFS